MTFLACFDGEPTWKREQVKDHTFSNINLVPFEKRGRRSVRTQIMYVFMYLLIFKSAFVLALDAVSLYFIFAGGELYDSQLGAVSKTVVQIVFPICVTLSFLITGWEWYKAQRLIETDDIAFTFTNTIALRYVSVNDFAKFVLFREINNYKKKKDQWAFFVFYTLQGWKQLLFVETPRRIINLTILLELLATGRKVSLTNIDNNFALIVTGGSVFIWAVSATFAVIAIILYIPLLCYIRGNLKAYVVHKIDKRIERLLRDKANRRTFVQDAGNVIVFNNQQNKDLRQAGSDSILSMPSTQTGPNPYASNAHPRHPENAYAGASRSGTIDSSFHRYNSPALSSYDDPRSQTHQSNRSGTVGRYAVRNHEGRKFKSPRALALHNAQQEKIAHQKVTGDTGDHTAYELRRMERKDDHTPGQSMSSSFSSRRGRTVYSMMLEEEDAANALDSIADSFQSDLSVQLSDVRDSRTETRQRSNTLERHDGPFSQEPIRQSSPTTSIIDKDDEFAHDDDTLYVDDLDSSQAYRSKKPQDDHFETFSGRDDSMLEHSEMSESSYIDKDIESHYLTRFDSQYDSRYNSKDDFH